MNERGRLNTLQAHQIGPNDPNTLLAESLEKTLCRIIEEEEETRVEEIDFPIYFGDLRKLRQEYSLWKTHFPRVEVFYAVKCCSETPILKELVQLNSSFDCASQREMTTILDLGVDPSRIIYANTIKSVSAIRYAAENGVSLMTFDNEFELDKIKKFFPNARLIIRLGCKQSNHTGLVFGMKFGCSMNKIEAMLNIAKSERLNVVGVSFHVGCHTDNGEPYVQALLDAHKVFQIGKEAGFNFNILDIGGGFVGYYGPGVSFEKTAEKVNHTLDEYFPPERGVRIIAEPGSRLVTSTFTLAVKVIGKASNENMEEGHVVRRLKMIPVKAKFLYYVNNGVYGSVTDNLEQIPNIKVLRHEGPLKEETYPSVVFGPTCDPNDCLYPSIMLPELDIGDWLYLEHSGAYSLSFASDFNMMDKAECFYGKD